MSARPTTENPQLRSGLLDLVDALAARPGDLASPLSATQSAAGAGLCLCLCVALPTA
jgi:hypothetical protein